MGWRDTHPQHEVPDWLDRHRALVDVTQSNDAWVIFRFGEPNDGVEVWVEHPDRGGREDDDDDRFVVWVNYVHPRYERHAGTEDALEVIGTEDSAVVGRVADWAVAQVAAVGSWAFAGSHQGDLVFDELGKPLVPLKLRLMPPA